MKQAIIRVREILGEDDLGRIADMIANMRPEEYVRFRARMLLGRYVGEKSYRELLDVLGLEEAMYAHKKIEGGNNERA